MPSCSKTQKIDFELEGTISLINITSNKSSKIIDLTVNDKEYVELNNWLKNNKDGWQAIKTEIYPTYVIHFGKYFLGVVNNKAIIFKKVFVDSIYVYEKPLNKNELSFLQKS